MINPEKDLHYDGSCREASFHAVAITVELTVFTTIEFTAEMEDPDSVVSEAAKNLINNALNTARYFSQPQLVVGSSPSVSFNRGPTSTSLINSGSNVIALFTTTVSNPSLSSLLGSDQVSRAFSPNFANLEFLVGQLMAEELAAKIERSISRNDEIFIDSDPLLGVSTSCVVDGILKTSTTTTTTTSTTTTTTTTTSTTTSTTTTTTTSATTTTTTTTTTTLIVNDGGVNFESYDWATQPGIEAVCPVTTDQLPVSIFL